MKAIERKKIEQMLEKVDKEIAKAENLCDIASENCKQSGYTNNAYQYYQQRYEYLKGLQMAKTIIHKNLKELI